MGWWRTVSKKVSISASAAYEGDVSKDAEVSFSGDDTELLALWASLTAVIGQWIGMTAEEMCKIFNGPEGGVS